MKRQVKSQRSKVKSAPGDIQRGQCVEVSAITSLEIALPGDGRKPIAAGLNDLLNQLETSPAFRIIPLASDIALEVMALGRFAARSGGPGDCRHRSHPSPPATDSGQRIVESSQVPVVESTLFT